MAMPLDLVLVRHGESVGNEAIRDAKEGKRSPPPHEQHSSRLWLLTQRGEEQARASGAWLRENGLGTYDRFYCSPYVRTMQTAAFLGLPDSEWRLEPLLRERDRGYEYVAPAAELDAVFPHSARTKKDDRFLWRPTAGESIPDVDLRLREVLGTLAREVEGRRVICVTHEDAMDALRFRLEKMTITTFIGLAANSAEPIPNGGVLHYTRRADPDSDSEPSPRDRRDAPPKFGWVRLVDPSGEGGFNWRPIERRTFNNDELEAMAKREGTQVAGP